MDAGTLTTREGDLNILTHRKALILQRIGDRLRAQGMIRIQDSVWHHPGAVALHVWVTMIDLRTIAPLGIFPSVVRKLQMFQVPTPILIFDAGISSPALLGPTSHGLIPHDVAGQELQEGHTKV
jgi:hypothetical protein